VVYGKGGIGKSTVAVHLSAAWAERGLRVLHVGCDPKMDSTLRLTGVEERPCVVDFIEDRTLRQREPADLIVRGPTGVDTIETGGPEPGVGCAGRGVASLLDWMDLKRVRTWPYDVVLFDVLGDLVCGGFVAPVRYGVAQRVVIVASAEPMALFAANNISRVVLRHVDDDVRLAGIVFNVKEPDDRVRAALDTFAARLGVRVLAHIGWSRAVRDAEQANRTAIEHDPSSEAAGQFRALAVALREPLPPDLGAPTPLDRRELLSFIRSLRL
jgi:nitrogenase iron protein NifH